METTNVKMTAEELAAYKEFKQVKEKQAAAEKAKQSRELYKTMVDNEIEQSIPQLQSLSEGIKETKSGILANFKAILDMKQDVLKITKNEQRSHTFTNSKGDKRITLGVYETDGWRDTVEEGIMIVREYIESLAGDDPKTKSLVSMVFRLLAKDSKGAIKASRVMQLRKMAEESQSERFIEGVKVIEEAYQPAISKQFIRAEYKDENGMWKSIPLGMTEA